MADIIQKIKILAQTQKAIKQLDSTKKAAQSIPSELQLNYQKYTQSVTKIKQSFLALSIAATATFAILYKGFVGIGEDVKSVNQMNTAIQTMGLQAQISAKQLFDYFGTLQTKIGQSASTLGTIAQSFISSGAKTQQQVQRLIQASIGLAERSGITTEQAADKIQKAMLGNVKGLKQFGIAAKDGQTKQDLLNEALRQGSIAFNNIDPNSPDRLIAR